MSKVRVDIINFVHYGPLKRGSRRERAGWRDLKASRFVVLFSSMLSYDVWGLS